MKHRIFLIVLTVFFAMTTAKAYAFDVKQQIKIEKDLIKRFLRTVSLDIQTLRGTLSYLDSANITESICSHIGGLSGKIAFISENLDGATYNHLYHQKFSKLAQQFHDLNHYCGAHSFKKPSQSKDVLNGDEQVSLWATGIESDLEKIGQSLQDYKRKASF